MKYSVHSIASVSQQSITTEPTLSYGKLYVNQLDKTLYVVDKYGKIDACGDSYRYLEEFSDFSIVDNYDGALVTMVRDIYGELVVGAKLPSIQLQSLSDFEEPLNRFNTYLTFINNSLTGVEGIKLHIPELSDVKIDNPNSYANNNYVLRWNASNAAQKINRINSNIPKDILGEPIYGYWDLAPEASTIVGFDDGNGYLATPRQIFRIPNLLERSRFKYVNSPLSIKWDKSPKLAGHLNGDNYSILNQSYKTHSIVLTSTISNISIDPAFMSSILLKPNSTVKLIEIDINSGNLTDFTARHVGLFIQNYQGSIKFNNNVVFENGRIPVIDGYDTLLSISVKKEADVSITITQKTMSTRN